jgi:hypothetical protein
MTPLKPPSPVLPSTRRRALLAAAAGATLGLVTGAKAQTRPGAAARPVPSELTAFGPAGTGWRLQGSGVLRFFGFKAYDAYLWSVGGNVNPLLGNQPFALEIEYSTSLRAEEIVNVSLVEMARVRRLSEEQVKTWNQEMQRSFPSVKPGDRLLGVQVPAAGTRFFHNGRLVSEISDPAFGNAFFAIWLDEQTKRPELRRDLLGTAAAAPNPRP